MIQDTRPEHQTKLKRESKQTKLRDGFISYEKEETLDSFSGNKEEAQEGQKYYDAHRGVETVTETYTTPGEVKENSAGVVTTVNDKEVEFEALRDKENDNFVCKYCGQYADGSETECSDCYAWWSLEGKDGRKMEEKFREDGGFWRECRECGHKFLPRFNNQKCCDSCREGHDSKPIFHPSLDPECSKHETVWECKDCGKLFYGGL